MGQLIGLSILLLVIYAIAASISKRNRSRIERLPHYNAADTRALEHKINHLQSLLDQQHRQQQEQLQVAYQQGFQDGIKQQSKKITRYKRASAHYKRASTHRDNLFISMHILQRDIIISETQAAEYEQEWMDSFYVGIENRLQETVTDHQCRTAIGHYQDWLQQIQDHVKCFKVLEEHAQALMPQEQADKMLYLANDSSNIQVDTDYSIYNESWYENMFAANEKILENLKNMRKILEHNQKLLMLDLPDVV